MEVAGSTIYHKTEYRERRNHYAVYSVNHPVNGFDTSRDAFIGLYNSPADPQAVRKGFCSGSIAHGWAPVASHHIHLKLRPGDSVSLVFVLGYCENPKDKKFSAPGVINKEPADRLLARYQTTEQVMAAFQELKILDNASVRLYDSDRRCQAEPYGEYMEPVSVHGYI